MKINYLLYIIGLLGFSASFPMAKSTPAVWKPAKSSIQDYLDEDPHFFDKNRKGVALSFKNLKLASLKGLENIPHIDEIEEVYFINNDLEALKPGDLAALKSVKGLSFHKNKIRKISPNVFVSDTLRFLNLSNNQIMEIEPFSFIEAKNLKDVNLSKNNLAKLSDESLAGLDNLEIIGVADNPWIKINLRPLANLKTVVLDMQQGQIILFHDKVRSTVQALSKEGYPIQLVSIEEEKPVAELPKARL